MRDGAADGASTAFGAVAIGGLVWLAWAGLLMPVLDGQPDPARILPLLTAAVAGAVVTLGGAGVASFLQLRAEADDVAPDRWAAAAMEVAMVFLVVVLAVGALWSRLLFGRYWTWSPLAVATVFGVLARSGYVAVRDLGESRRQRARRAAILNLLTLLDVPLVYVSVAMWHDDRALERAFVVELDGASLWVVATSALAMVPIAAWLTLTRHRSLAAVDRIEAQALDSAIVVRRHGRDTPMTGPPA